MVDSRLVAGLFLVMVICLATMANGNSINRHLNNEARRASFEERNFDLSDDNDDDDMEPMQRREFKSIHFKSLCYNAAQCSDVCKSMDGVKDGHCSQWAGDCMCNQ